MLRDGAARLLSMRVQSILTLRRGYSQNAPVSKGEGYRPNTVTTVAASSMPKNPPPFSAAAMRAPST